MPQQSHQIPINLLDFVLELHSHHQTIGIETCSGLCPMQNTYDRLDATVWRVLIFASGILCMLVTAKTPLTGYVEAFARIWLFIA